MTLWDKDISPKFVNFFILEKDTYNIDGTGIDWCPWRSFLYLQETMGSGRRQEMTRSFENLGNLRFNDQSRIVYSWPTDLSATDSNITDSNATGSISKATFTAS